MLNALPEPVRNTLCGQRRASAERAKARPRKKPYQGAQQPRAHPAASNATQQYPQRRLPGRHRQLAPFPAPQPGLHKRLAPPLPPAAQRAYRNPPSAADRFQPRAVGEHQRAHHREQRRDAETPAEKACRGRRDTTPATATAQAAPSGIGSGLAALTVRERNDGAAIRLAQSALAEARYQAERAQAQFDAIDPANQNVFHNLARKWEACLSRARSCEARLQTLEGSKDRQRELTPEERDAYLALGEDLQRVWSHERTPPQLRKRLLRAVLVEIIATIKGREIHLLLHWKGGDHSHLVVPRNRTGEHRWTTDAQTRALIRDLARMLPDELIAGLLNLVFDSRK